MSKSIVSIDPGSKGFICLREPNETFKWWAIEKMDLPEISKVLLDIKNTHDNLICCIEEVHAVFGSAASSTFKFGFNVGYLHGILAASHIPFVTVQPKKWQKCVWINGDMVYKIKADKNGKLRKETNTKESSINCAKRLFPDLDFRMSGKCSKIHDGKVDATLIGEYARRNNL